MFGELVPALATTPLVAELTIAPATADGDAVGLVSRYRAAVPVTCGVAIDVPLIEPSFVAEAALQALRSDGSGQAWVVQPNRILQFRFPNVPGPR